MNTYFGLNTSGASTLFGSLSSNSGSSTTSLLSDYASIKSGSYYKLLKAYYAQAGDTSEATTTKRPETDNTDWKEAALDISSLKSKASTLSSAEYTEDNRSHITKSVSEFVKNYNATLDSTADVNSSSLASKAKWMTKITSSYSDTLEKVGITVKSDNTLSLDSETLSKASMKDLESAFSGSHSYAGQINSASRLMAQVAANGGSSTTSALYNSSGAYSNLSNASLYNYLF